MPPDDLSTAGRPRFPRHVALQVDQLRVGLEICLHGDLWAVLPEWLAEQSPMESLLWRLPFAGITDDALFATCRRRIELPTRADLVLRYVQAALLALRSASTAERSRPASPTSKRQPSAARRPPRRRKLQQ